MPLNNRTVLKALHEYIDEERMSEEKIRPGSEDALFLSLQGRRMTERQIRELVKKYTSIALSTSRSAGYSPHKTESYRGDIPHPTRKFHLRCAEIAGSRARDHHTALRRT